MLSHVISVEVYNTCVVMCCLFRLKLHRRQKNKRRNKLQEEFGDIWDQIDEESRYMESHWLWMSFFFQIKETGYT